MSDDKYLPDGTKKISRKVLTANFKALPTAPTREFVLEGFAKLDLKMRLKTYQGLRMREPLDYEKADLKLDVTSWGEVTRLRSCQKEPFTVDWIEAVVKPGDTFYDIGANVGAYSLVAAAHTQGKARIVAFEPAPANFDKLVRNAELNGFQGSITPMAMLLGEENGLIDFTLSGSEPGRGTHRVYRDDEALDAHKQYGAGEENEKPFELKFPAFRLETLVQQWGLPVPTHIKLDVEGHESAVLAGCGEVLKDEQLRSVLMEVREGEANDERNARCLELLEQAGLSIVARRRIRNKQGEELPLSYAVFAREAIPSLEG